MNFFNTERKSINHTNDLIKINDKQVQLNLNPISKNEDILIPFETETYLKVKKIF